VKSVGHDHICGNLRFNSSHGILLEFVVIRREKPVPGAERASNQSLGSPLPRDLD